MTDALRIAIVHYHLRAGGVTSVIKQAVASLQSRDVHVAVLSGAEAPPDIAGAKSAVVEGLNYADPSRPPCTPEFLVERLDEAAAKALGAPPDVWHIHNHSLGKNFVFTEAVFRMAERGSRLFLQIHDFPEDGRPANYRDLLSAVGRGDPGRLGARLYPQAPHVFYAVLNHRDARFLREAGCPAEHVCLLPNAVSGKVSANAGGAPPEDGLFLYPTRAIRRKNMGEFILWAACEPGARFAATLAPTNPADLIVYRRWKEFAASCGLPISFELGLDGKVPFQELLNSARAIVTTSVAEGFGLAFLEPWLAGRPLAGRDLPEMTEGFKKDGVSFPSLYLRARVPVEWIGLDVFRRKVESGLAQMMSAYGRAPRAGDVESAVAAATEGDLVDFGRLDEALQEQVIQRVHSSPALRAAVTPSGLAPDLTPEETIGANRRIVELNYGAAQYGGRLMESYRALMGRVVEPVGTLCAETLLDKFLSPERFFLIRT